MRRLTSRFVFLKFIKKGCLYILKTVKIILVATLLLVYTNISILAAAPDSSGKAAVLMDGSSGRVLYEKNSQQKLPMASTTKIMTAIVALEYGKLDDVITIPPEASGVEGSSIWLSPGEQHTLEDLLYGLMLRSGNDAATAIAIHIGGSIEGFAKLMNEMAYKIGAVNSNFRNPHGLPDNDHYTTAYDLALITSYGLKMPAFKTIVSTKYKTIPWDGHEWDRVMMNKNKLLWEYEGANGVKTGFTKKAGRCLVASSERNGMQLVTVVLNCGPMFEDSALLLDYGFKNYHNQEFFVKDKFISAIPVNRGKIEKLNLVAGKEFSMALTDNEKDLVRMEVVLPKTIEAPITLGQQFGSIKIYFDNHLMDEIPVIAAESIDRRSFWDFFRKMVNHWR